MTGILYRTAFALVASIALMTQGAGAGPLPVTPEEQALVTGYMSLKAGSGALQTPLTHMKDYIIATQERGGQSWESWRSAGMKLDDTRQEFAHAQRFLEEVRDKTTSPQIRALSEKLVRIYESFNRAMELQATAVRTENHALLRASVSNLRFELVNVVRVFATDVPALKAQVTEAMTERGVKQEEQIGCPHAFGTKDYFLECIGEGELSTSDRQ